QIDRAADALAVFSKSASGNDRNGLLIWRADIYFAGSKYREAASMCRGVLALRDATQDSKAHAEYQLGVCYHNSNMDLAARQAMENVTKRYSGLDWASKARGMLHLWNTYGVQKNNQR
ncbi:MAG: hypothetical protein GX141_02910, partial [Armatimonadetes bacterium]|nr:hypothetical protein [Armatimonadota bacterium]